MKWKMTCTKKIGQMTYEVVKEITDKIDSLEEYASHGSFFAHGSLEGSTTVHNISLSNDHVKVMWDATVFRVFNDNFPLYIKHMTETIGERGMLMCMGSSSHNSYRDLGNYNLNQKRTLTNGRHFA
ncbi:hypothetical protein GmHk_17G048868 [Glycine max]|nr:hypothetical protein GmHk_17G048868 [Glycine max]